MKKITSILLIFSLVLAVGCDSKNKDNSDMLSVPDRGTNIENPDPQTEQTTDNTADMTGETVPLSNSNKLVQYGVGKDVDSENRPTGATMMQKQYGDKGAVFIGSADEKKLYLTFDEGYEAGYTEQILQTLAEKNVKATFFITGGYLKYSKDMVDAIVEGGHQLGNHTENHPSLPKCSAEEIQSEIKTLHDSIKESYSLDMNVLRPPMGEFSDTSLAVANDLGYRSVFWSFAYVDWDTKKQPDPTTAYEKITKSTHNGAVILLHAVSKTNADILGKLIDYWQSEGYELALL